jgi:hypothetical protein
MGFKPLAFGLLSGDKPQEALKNAIGSSVAGKLYYDDEERRKKEAENNLAAAPGAAPAEAGMKKGGSVKGWGKARGARAAKYY